MSAEIPLISENDIRSWVGQASFQRGRAYFRQGAIQNPRCQGATLKANCLGSYAPSYRVEVTFDSDGIGWADCSCPVGGGGYCKHVAAMLLTWLDSPSVFKEIKDLDAALEQHSKSELIALIRRMLQREPDLEILLELPIPAEDTDQSPIDPDALREQVAFAFRGYGGDRVWLDLTDVAGELDTFLDLAESYLRLEKVIDAATIYQVVSEMILSHEEYVMGDEAGLLGWRIHACVEGLGQCLQIQEQPDQRQFILQALLEVYFQDLVMGGIGLGEQVPGLILKHTNVSERELVTELIRLRLKEAREWSRSILGGFLLELQAETLDDEAYLSLCRETGRLSDLVAKLLALRRVEEATTEASRAHDYELIVLADMFVQHNYKKVAEGLVRERVDTSWGLHFLDWLIDFQKNEGEFPEALALAERRFWQRPSVETYVEMRGLATTLERWSDLRCEILNRLAREELHGVRVEIFVEEGEIDLALEALEQVKPEDHSWGYQYHNLGLRVAAAAETERPNAAIHLYLQEAERLIDRRGRGNYAGAAEYLLRVREIYHHLDDNQSWETSIGDLRERHRRLPALQDELNKAGL